MIYLTSQGGPRTERIKKIIMAVDYNIGIQTKRKKQIKKIFMMTSN